MRPPGYELDDAELVTTKAYRLSTGASMAIVRIERRPSKLRHPVETTPRNRWQIHDSARLRSRPQTAALWPHWSPQARRREWFPGLDGLRGYLLLIVFSVHLPPPFIRPLDGGYIVMEVFFVLSGFLITTILLREFEQKGVVRLRLFYSLNRHSGAPGFVAHLWSLSVEEQFYFVWPCAL